MPLGPAHCCVVSPKFPPYFLKFPLVLFEEKNGEQFGHFNTKG
jgi:hypothetical protein